MVNISVLFLLIFAIGSHQQNILNGMAPPGYFENYYNNYLPNYQENFNYETIPSYGRQHQSPLYPNYHDSSFPSPYGFLNDYDDLSISDDDSTLFRNLPDGRNSNKHQKQNLNFASNSIKSSIQMDMPERYNDPLLLQRQLFPLLRPRNLLFTLVTSTIDITSTVTCAPSSVTIATTPSPTTGAPTTPPTTTPSGPIFFRSNASSAAIIGKPLVRTLETPIVPEDRLREFKEKNVMIKDILISSIEEIFEHQNYQYDNNRKKRMFFRYPVQTTLTSYVLNTVLVTNTFIPNGSSCPPPGYITCF